MGLACARPCRAPERGAAGGAPRPVGILNHQNNCFASAVLQALFALRPLREEIFRRGAALQSAADAAPDTVKEQSFVLALYHVFLALSAAGGRLRSRSAVVSIAPFLAELQQKSQLFALGEHHDAHEFHSFVISELAECASRGAARAEERDPRGREEGEAPRRKDDWISGLFKGQLACTTECLYCGTATQKREAFMDLQLDVHRRACVRSALESLEATEVLKGTNKYYCSECLTHHWAMRSSQLAQLPPLLTIHLKLPEEKQPQAETIAIA